MSKEEIEDVFNRCDLPLNIRGEALTLEQFAMLANCIYDEKGNSAGFPVFERMLI